MPKPHVVKVETLENPRRYTDGQITAAYALAYALGSRVFVLTMPPARFPKGYEEP